MQGQWARQCPARTNLRLNLIYGAKTGLGYPSFILEQIVTHKNPSPTVDIIIEMVDRPDRPIILIERLNPPYGWAIPGGFMDYGEPAETTARREAIEEIGLAVNLVELLNVYSDPARDARQHTVSAVYIATAKGEPKAGDDAKTAKIVNVWEIPDNLCFDHDRILHDYLQLRHYGIRPRVG